VWSFKVAHARGRQPSDISHTYKLNPSGVDRTGSLEATAD
jgi:hypothetical protein